MAASRREVGPQSEPTKGRDHRQVNERAGTNADERGSRPFCDAGISALVGSGRRKRWGSLLDDQAEFTAELSRPCKSYIRSSRWQRLRSGRSFPDRTQRATRTAQRVRPASAPCARVRRCSPSGR
jgi:hypothetical protein